MSDPVSMDALLAMNLCHPVVLRYASSKRIALKWCKSCHSFLERCEGESPCPVRAVLDRKVST
jgi:hypothetical protein